MTEINTVYPSQAFRYQMTITSPENKVRFGRTVVSTFSDQTTPVGDSMFANGSNDLELRLATMIQAAYLAIHGALEAITVVINSRGRLEIDNPGVKVLYIIFSSFTTFNMNIYGFDINESSFRIGPEEISESPFQVGLQWIPNMFNESDSGDMVVQRIAQSNTNAMIPRYIKYADDYFIRSIVWVALAAARVRQSRADSQLFADNAQLTVGDPNAALEVLLRYVNTEGLPGLGVVYLFDQVAGEGATVLGQYYILLMESSILKGIADESRHKESSLERFDLTLKMRKV